MFFTTLPPSTPRLLDGPFPVVFTSCTTLPNPASLTAHVSRCKGWYTPHRNQLSKYLAAPSLTSLGLIGRDRRHKKSTKYEKHREGFIFHICSGEQNVRVCTSVPLVMKAPSRKPGKIITKPPATTVAKLNDPIIEPTLLP